MMLVAAALVSWRALTGAAACPSLVLKAKDEREWVKETPVTPSKATQAPAHDSSVWYSSGEAQGSMQVHNWILPDFLAPIVQSSVDRWVGALDRG